MYLDKKLTQSNVNKYQRNRTQSQTINISITKTAEKGAKMKQQQQATTRAPLWMTHQSCDACLVHSGDRTKGGGEWLMLTSSLSVDGLRNWYLEIVALRTSVTWPGGGWEARTEDQAGCVCDGGRGWRVVGAEQRAWEYFLSLVEGCCCWCCAKFCCWREDQAFVFFIGSGCHFSFSYNLCSDFSYQESGSLCEYANATRVESHCKSKISTLVFCLKGKENWVKCRFFLLITRWTVLGVSHYRTGNCANTAGDLCVQEKESGPSR